MYLPLVTLILGLYIGDVELHDAHPPGIPPPNFNQQQQAHHHPAQPPSQQAGQGQQNMQFQQQQQQQQQQGQFQDPNVQHMQQQPHGHQHGGFRQQHEVHNAEHIKEHLKEVIDKPKEEMTEQELEFHYFKLHDYDGNNKLDGIEITKAITHFHQGEEGHYNRRLYTDKQLMEIVDQILKDEDVNDNGYIEYFEYAVIRRKQQEEVQKKVDKVQSDAMKVHIPVVGSSDENHGSIEAEQGSSQENIKSADDPRV